MTVSSSTAALSVPATVTLQPGQTTGTFTAQAAAAIAATVSGSLTVTYNGGTAVAAFTLLPLAPAIQGVAGAGQSVPPVLSLVTGGLFSIYGSDFAALASGRPVGTADIANNMLPTNLAQTCVRVGAALAPLNYVSRTQINAIAPALPAAGTVPVSVVTNCGTATAATTTAVLATVVSAAPELLSFAASPDGISPVAAVESVTGAYVGPVGLIPGVVFAPAVAGDVLTIFGVGFGPTASQDPPGTVAGAAAGTLGQATVTIGGVPAQVLYAGLTPTFAGLYQLNLIVPAGIPGGNQPIVLEVNGASSPPGAYLAIGH
jgi:uncharacterized protein (TIGR03437 family)